MWQYEQKAEDKNKKQRQEDEFMHAKSQWLTKTKIFGRDFVEMIDGRTHN